MIIVPTASEACHIPHVSRAVSSTTVCDQSAPGLPNEGLWRPGGMNFAVWPVLVAWPASIPTPPIAGAPYGRFVRGFFIVRHDYVN